VPAGDGTALVLRGRELSASDQRVLVAFAAHVSAAAERDRLARAAAEVEPVKAADRMRTALLAAVSHDLRTPLAVGWAAVSSLRSHDVDFSAEDREELLATAEESLARLSRLVENLLDMSRLQAGALRLDLRPTALEEVLPAALEALPSDAPGIDAHGLEEAPAVAADPPLLERVIANLLANAARHAPRNRPVVLTASALGDRVELRVVDRGPGLPASDRERAFEPFQRMGDNDNTTGLGLGLALARGLTEAMGGTLTPEDTPGGGLTMVLSLPAATTCPVPPPDPGPAPTGPGTPPADPAADDLADAEAPAQGPTSTEPDDPPARPAADNPAHPGTGPRDSANTAAARRAPAAPSDPDHPPAASGRGFRGPAGGPGGAAHLPGAGGSGPPGCSGGDVPAAPVREGGGKGGAS
jgi:two-component system sensor histidine kinase KdpD